MSAETITTVSLGALLFANRNGTKTVNGQNYSVYTIGGQSYFANGSLTTFTQFQSNPIGTMPTSLGPRSDYGNRIHPKTGVITFHNGVDLTKPGGTDVMSVLDGTVSFTGWNKDRGWYMKIDSEINGQKNSNFISAFRYERKFILFGFCWYSSSGRETYRRSRDHWFQHRTALAF